METEIIRYLEWLIKLINKEQDHVTAMENNFHIAQIEKLIDRIKLQKEWNEFR
jgi:hypothetical protein